MSIIAEALKKAGKERDKSITSKEHLSKIFGPERKATYKRKEFKADKPQLQPEASLSDTKDMGPLKVHYVKSKTLIATGVLLLLAIIFLTVTNIFFIPSPDMKVAASRRAFDFTAVPIEAETYTDLKSEVALIEHKIGLMDKMALLQDEFSSHFMLNGIVYDVDDSWAIINNEVVRAGDTLGGAEIISIAPQKVSFLFKGEKFDLAVK